MSSEPINLSNINLQGALNPANGFVTAEMLRAALGLSGTDDIVVGKRIGAIPAAEFTDNPNSAIGWIWQPATVQSLMTASAAATARSQIAAARASGH